MDSFKGLKKIYNEVKQTIDKSKVHIFIVGNKNDLYDKEEVKKEEVEQYAKSIKATLRIVSALNGSGVKQLFEDVAKALLTNKFGDSSNTNDDKNKVVLSPKDLKKKNKNQEKKKCC